MPKMRRWVLVLTALGGLAGAAGVVLSAVAAHGSAGPLLETAANYLLLHACAIVAITAHAQASPRFGTWFLVAALMLVLGSALFSGDLATRALHGTRVFPMAAPAGGMLLILGWFQLAMASLRELTATSR